MYVHRSFRLLTLGVNGVRCFSSDGRPISTVERSTIPASSSSPIKTGPNHNSLNKTDNQHISGPSGSCYYFQSLRESPIKSDSGPSTAYNEQKKTSILSFSLPKLNVQDDMLKNNHGDTEKSKDSQNNSGKHKFINGIFRGFVVDTSVPPISREELIRWRLDRILHNMSVYISRSAQSEPNFLLPPNAMVTSLGPKMDQIDAIYRKKGWFTPSEVAEVFIKLTPTFYVETRHIFNLIPSNVMIRIDSQYLRKEWVGNIFARYPMLFKLSRPSFQRSVVKLNADLWFVRAHPDFKKGNCLHYKNNAEYHVGAGGVMSRNVPTGEAADEADPAAAGGSSPPQRPLAPPRSPGSRRRSRSPSNCGFLIFW
ncbi:unnamed protein product [Phytomonas sp. Hart1]|nr:unnamed protein product [Phytomonas sp. Hart1]|eukprot:CCW66574.1 unnamed protein product [Phytomonas sp. isolate Hart1]